MRHINWGITVSIGLLIAISFSAFTQAPDREHTGQDVFEKKCAKCHGKDGTRGLFGAKNLQTSQLTDSALYNTISKGRKIMPGWEKKLSPEELRLVTVYVKSLRK